MRKFLPFFWILLGFSTSACLNLLGLQKERTYHLDRIVSHDVIVSAQAQPDSGPILSWTTRGEELEIRVSRPKVCAVTEEISLDRTEITERTATMAGLAYITEGLFAAMLIPAIPAALSTSKDEDTGEETSNWWIGVMLGAIGLLGAIPMIFDIIAVVDSKDDLGVVKLPAVTRSVHCGLEPLSGRTVRIAWSGGQSQDGTTDTNGRVRFNIHAQADAKVTLEGRDPLYVRGLALAWSRTGAAPDASIEGEAK